MRPGRMTPFVLITVGVPVVARPAHDTSTHVIVPLSTRTSPSNATSGVTTVPRNNTTPISPLLSMLASVLHSPVPPLHAHVSSYVSPVVHGLPSSQAPPMAHGGNATHAPARHSSAAPHDVPSGRAVFTQPDVSQESAVHALLS